MDEYIKREAAIEAVKHAWAKGLEPSQYIEIITAADVAPVRHGRWVHHIAGGKQISACWCSVCNVEHETEQNYCPNCGAKMDGGADHLISNGVTVQGWISVKDRLPDNKEHDWVLAQVVEDNGYMHIPRVMEYRQAKDDWFEETYGWLSEHNGLFSVTHWMPLPNPPKGE